jgi:hypothetical protein
MLTSRYFLVFSLFFYKKRTFFLKTNAVIFFVSMRPLICDKFAIFFGENISKIKTSVPGRRSSDYDVYGGNLFPLEEVTDLLMRTVSPRGSVANDDDVGRRRRYRRHAAVSSVSGSVTGGRSIALWNRSGQTHKIC